MQNEEYKNWLRQQWEQDEKARKAGLAPVPRSKEERMAIFVESPIWFRTMAARKAARERQAAQ